MRLTWINIVVTAFIIIVSSWMIYSTACSLADSLVTVDNQKQNQFESTLLTYLWIFSIAVIIIGGLLHFYLTKKMTKPLYNLIEMTKQMKQGQYPSAITVSSQDEIGQLTTHFNDLAQQLKTNHQHRQKMVSDLSHEIRTPLTNINGYLKALHTGVIDPDPKLFESLHEESRRLIELIHQMDQLKESDYVAQQTFYEKAPVDMHILVKQMVEMFQWSLKEAGIPLTVHSSPSTISGDQNEIAQVLSNFMDNAVRYYKAPGDVTIHSEIIDSLYRFSITGPGQSIPAEEQQRIFERFYRIEDSRARDVGGSGLGLAISKEIIEHHQGDIGIESDGSIHTFWFTLPVE